MACDKNRSIGIFLRKLTCRQKKCPHVDVALKLPLGGKVGALRFNHTCTSRKSFYKTDFHPAIKNYIYGQLSEKFWMYKNLFVHACEAAFFFYHRLFMKGLFFSRCKSLLQKVDAKSKRYNCLHFFLIFRQMAIIVETEKMFKIISQT